MIVLDAGVLIAALDASDAHEAAARALFEQHTEARIHPVNLGEALVGAVRLGKQTAAEHGLALLGVQRAELGDGHALDLARLRVETGLKMPDCCALACAEELSVPLATLDRQLARVARSRGVTVLP